MVHAHRQENRPRAELLSPSGWHGRVDPKGAGLVGAGGNHPTLLLVSPDDDRATTKSGLVTLLDGCIKGVHVQVDDRIHGRGASCDTAGAKAASRALPFTACSTRTGNQDVPSRLLIPANHARESHGSIPGDGTQPSSDG